MKNKHVAKLIKSFNLLYDVLEEIADDKNLDPRILTKLYKEAGWHFYGTLAFNPNTPVNILEEMLERTESESRKHILCNPNLPLGVIRKQIKNEFEEDVREVAMLMLAKRLLGGGGGSPNELLKFYDKIENTEYSDETLKEPTLSAILKNPKFPKEKRKQN